MTFRKGNSAHVLFIGEDVGVGDAKGVVDGNMDKFPIDTTRVALAGSISGDAMADPIKTTQALDIKVDQTAWSGILIKHDGRRRVPDPSGGTVWRASALG